MTDVRRLARRASRSDGASAAARAGLGARAVVWTLIGLLAASVALGGGGQAEADQGGALRTVAASPAGGLLLVVLALAFLGLALHHVLEGVGRSDGALARLEQAGKTVVYLVAAAACVRTVVGRAPDGEQEADSVTARLMELPGGRVLVGLVGAAAVVLAAVLLVRALRHRHGEKVSTPTSARRPLLWLGVLGHAGRSLAVALVGVFLVQAALDYDPEQARGLDAALQALRDQPAGPVLLLVAAGSLLAYGLWSAAEAVWSVEV